MNKKSIDAEGLLLLIGESTGPQTRVRDAGILVASAVRPGARLAEKMVYRGLSWRLAALLHSILRWKPLDMWNASFGWRAVAVLARVNGCEFTAPAKERMIITDEISDGSLDDVGEIAARLDPYLLAR
jgi:death-on-curing protein